MNTSFRSNVSAGSVANINNIVTEEYYAKPASHSRLNEGGFHDEPEDIEVESSSSGCGTLGLLCAGFLLMLVPAGVGAFLYLTRDERGSGGIGQSDFNRTEMPTPTTLKPTRPPFGFPPSTPPPSRPPPNTSPTRPTQPPFENPPTKPIPNNRPTSAPGPTSGPRPTAAPRPTAGPPNSEPLSVRDFLVAEAATVGGDTALFDPTSPQSEAVEWVLDNRLLDTYSSPKIVQRYVLATLYYSTTGTSWTNSDGWLSDQDDCEWYSSEKDNPICGEEGDLDEIDLDSNGLAGAIPWNELALLSSQLVILDFFRNDLRGSLPSQFGLLTSLAALDLFSNQISGKIPTEIGLLTSLKYQDCDTNFLSGTIPTHIADMVSLETLWLNDNLLSGTIPSEIGLMTNLRSLYLTNNYLSGSVPEEVCALNLANLEVNCGDVQCDCCTNTECGSSNVGDPLLELLMSISPDGGEALEDTLSPQYAALEWLRSPVNDSYKSDDNRMFQRFVLATLYYSTAGDNWNTAFLWLTSANECLWFTSSNSRKICDPDRNIMELDLRENNLKGRVPDELVLLSDTLVSLRLPRNSITGTIPSFFPEMSNLGHLDISSNKLIGTLPASIGLMTALTHLALFENNLSSTIPPLAGQLVSLHILDVGANDFSGTIPTELGLLVELAGLSLFDNLLTGTIPTQLQRLSALEILYLDANDLGGTVPQDICGFDLVKFWSDCEEVNCACCTTCCDDSTGCY